MRSEADLSAMIGRSILRHLMLRDDAWSRAIGDVPYTQWRVRLANIGPSVLSLFIGGHRNIPTANLERHLQEGMGRLGRLGFELHMSQGTRMRYIGEIDDGIAGMPAARISL